VGERAQLQGVDILLFHYPKRRKRVGRSPQHTSSAQTGKKQGSNLTKEGRRQGGGGEGERAQKKMKGLAYPGRVTPGKETKSKSLARTGRKKSSQERGGS